LSTHPLHPPLTQNVRWRGCFLFDAPPPTSPLLELRDGGVFCQHTPSTPLPHSKCEMEGFFVNTPPPPPSLTRNVRWRGCFLFDVPPPTPPLLELRDGGVFCQHTPSTKGRPFVVLVLPPPPSLEKRDGGGDSVVDTSLPTPPLARIARRRGSWRLVDTSPPPPSLTRNVRWRGCFLFNAPPTPPSLKL
jgi:hypothetical protein